MTAYTKIKPLLHELAGSHLVLTINGEGQTEMYTHSMTPAQCRKALSAVSVGLVDYLYSGEYSNQPQRVWSLMAGPTQAVCEQAMELLRQMGYTGLVVIPMHEGVAFSWLGTGRQAMCALCTLYSQLSEDKEGKTDGTHAV